jgi:hypothetical protein
MRSLNDKVELLKKHPSDYSHVLAAALAGVGLGVVMTALYGKGMRNRRLCDVGLRASASGYRRTAHSSDNSGAPLHHQRGY